MLFFFFFFRKIREEKYRLLSKPRCGGVRPRSGAMERRRLKEAGVCGALPKACDGHLIALDPVPDPPTVQVLLRALKDRLPLNTVTDSDFIFFHVNRSRRLVKRSQGSD